MSHLPAQYHKWLQNCVGGPPTTTILSGMDIYLEDWPNECTTESNSQQYLVLLCSDVLDFAREAKKISFTRWTLNACIVKA